VFFSGGVEWETRATQQNVRWRIFLFPHVLLTLVLYVLALRVQFELKLQAQQSIMSTAQMDGSLSGGRPYQALLKRLPPLSTAVVSSSPRSGGSTPPCSAARRVNPPRGSAGPGKPRVGLPPSSMRWPSMSIPLARWRSGSMPFVCEGG